ncbi:endospore germination permease [Metabacillus herbersteinensis]|uniref:Endospore germination permease n=1 Tax=Metabacillus herbersteinensis TaxID=283816 RepID=A0ABV6GEF1_9BACI
MLEKGKITAGEFQIIVITITVGSSILVAPSLLATLAKQDAWIASVLTIIIGLLFIFIYNQLASLYPSMTYVECNEKLFGKWIGKITALLYLFYVYHLCAALLREIGDFLTTQVMVETPIQMIMIMFLFVSLIGVRLGIEVICRTAVIFFPWIIILLFMLFFLLIPEIKFENIQPIFGEGIKPIMKGSFSNLGLPYLELIVFLMITPYVTEKAKIKNAFYKGTIIGGIIITILITFSTLILGSDFTSRHAYPSYILGKKIRLADFIERIEVIVAIIWFFTMYFKLTIFYYVLSLGLAQLFGLKNYQILLYPLAFLIITFSIIAHPDIVHLQNFILKTWTPYSLTICFFLPLLLLVIGKIRKKKSASKASKQL